MDSTSDTAEAGQMRPFLRRHRVAEAWQWIDQCGSSPPRRKQLSLPVQPGEYSQPTLSAPCRCPALCAMMDGYAVQRRGYVGRIGPEPP